MCKARQHHDWLHPRSLQYESLCSAFCQEEPMVLSQTRNSLLTQSTDSRLLSILFVSSLCADQVCVIKLDEIYNMSSIVWHMVET